MFRLILASALVALACADHPAPSYAPAPYHPAPAYGKPAAYDESPKPYAFQYGVADDYSGANFNAQETADGKAVSGSYQVSFTLIVEFVTYCLICLFKIYRFG